MKGGCPHEYRRGKRTVDFRAYFGITRDQTDLLWQKVLEDYLGTAEEEILQRASDKIRLLACVRFLQLLVSEPWDNQELHGLRIRHTLEHISELLPRVHTLELT